MKHETFKNEIRTITNIYKEMQDLYAKCEDKDIYNTLNKLLTDFENELVINNIYEEFYKNYYED
jgi:NADH:ubiquinone oxidoreductase subunit F (NADH-binding)